MVGIIVCLSFMWNLTAVVAEGVDPHRYKDGLAVSFTSFNDGTGRRTDSLGSCKFSSSLIMSLASSVLAAFRPSRRLLDDDTGGGVLSTSPQKPHTLCQHPTPSDDVFLGSCHTKTVSLRRVGHAASAYGFFPVHG